MKDELYEVDQLACVSKGRCYLPPPPNLPHRIQTSYPQPYKNIFEKRERLFERKKNVKWKWEQKLPPCLKKKQYC